MKEITEREYAELVKRADQVNEVGYWVKLVSKILAGIVVGIIAIVLLFRVVGPQLNLYRANTEKQAVIAEQRAQSEAAEFAARSAVTQAQARAEATIIEAQALAESQAIIAETLTDDYMRYLYIKALEGNPNQIIYVPTEAGLPILEAGRGTEDETP